MCIRDRSYAGITGGIHMFGDRNTFGQVLVRDNPSFGIADYGTENTFLDVDISCETTAINVLGTGGRYQGRAVSRGSDSISRDVIINAGVENCDIDIRGGTRGLIYASGVAPHHSNRIEMRGPAPYTLGVRRAHAYEIIGLTDVAQRLKVAGPGTNGQTDITAPPYGEVYQITLATVHLSGGLVSKYMLTGTGGGGALDALHEGVSPAIPTFVPKLRIDGGDATKIEVYKDNAAALDVKILVEKM